MDYDRTPAPAELERLETFVNSARFRYDEEHLVDPETADRWLREHGFTDGRIGLDHQSLRELVQFREALREHLGGEAPEATRALNAYAERTLAAPRWNAAGAATLTTRGNRVDALIGDLLAIAFIATLAGTLSRLKPCQAPECRWLFYDRSPAGNSVWCSMRICGSRHKMRAYRSRQTVRDRV